MHNTRPPAVIHRIYASVFHTSVLTSFSLLLCPPGRGFQGFGLAFLVALATTPQVPRLLRLQSRSMKEGSAI
jgi:hypothetical protein